MNNLFGSNDKNVQSAAACVMILLCFMNPENQSRFMACDGLVSKVYELLKNKNQAVITNTLSVIISLSGEHPENQSLFGKYDGFFSRLYLILMREDKLIPVVLRTIVSLSYRHPANQSLFGSCSGHAKCNSSRKQNAKRRLES